MSDTREALCQLSSKTQLARTQQLFLLFIFHIQQSLKCCVFAFGHLVSFFCGTCCLDWRSDNEEGSYRQELRCERRSPEKDAGGGQSSRTCPFFCKTNVCPHSFMTTDQRPVYSLYNVTSMSHAPVTVCITTVTCGLVSFSSAPPSAPLHRALLIASPSWGQYVSQH